MTRALTIAAVFLALSAPAFTTRVPRQDQRPTFRTSTARVRVDAIVTDKGRPVAGLTAGDFEIKDNGVLAQDLEVITSSDSVAVAILLDLSGSVQEEGLKELTDACEALVTALQPGDEAWVVTFADAFTLKAGPVRDPAVIRRALASIRPGGGTSLWDVLFGGVSLVNMQAGRSMVLVFSDGADSTSWMGEDRGLDTLRRSPVVISAIRPPFVPDGFMQLERAAIATGGVVVTAARGAKLETQFVDLLREFRLGYVLSYPPTGIAARNGWHEIDVRLKSKSGKVRARKGYFEPGR
jgi:Ca-activated chloride channel family protein